MTRPDHTAVPPADVIAAAEPIYQVRFEQSWAWHDASEDAYHTFMPQRRRVVYALAEGAAPTAAQAAGRSVADLPPLPEPEDVDHVRFAYTADQMHGYGQDCYAAGRASHAPNATLAASRDAESATSGATSAAKVEPSE
jgi:hypothetical protein